MRYEFSDVRIPGKNWNKYTSKDVLQYAVGGLLYTPAVHASVAENIKSKKYPHIKSMALCLEDSITDHSIGYAEDMLIHTLSKIHEYVLRGEVDIDDLPLIFIRIRNPEQMKSLSDRLCEHYEVITGFIIPKFNLDNAKDYTHALHYVNRTSPRQKIYIMPIIESHNVLDINTRIHQLSGIREALSEIKDYVLNVRVGGNDFCSRYGFRRSSRHTIYDIGVLNSVLSDIMNMLGTEYIISAPVWEYFSGSTVNGWAEGLKREIEKDKLNGFIGKTAIHPSQLEVIQRSMVVDYGDYMDAKAILDMGKDVLGVQKSIHNERMNEVKVHMKWAHKILKLADIYGVDRNEESSERMV